MSSWEKWLVPYMVLSAWLAFVLVAIGLVIRSPNGLIEVTHENKRTKEIASYVTATVHGVFFLLCAVAKYRKRAAEFGVVEETESNISS